MANHPHLRTKNYSAFAWAIFSQSIWVPVVIIDAHDRLATSNSDFKFTSQIPFQETSREISRNLSLQIRPSSEVINRQGLANRNQHSGIVLSSILPMQQRLETHAIEESPLQSTTTSPIAFSAPISPKPYRIALMKSSNSQQHTTIPVLGAPLNAGASLYQLYSRSELLGGEISLGDLNEPEMPPVARAQRAQWIRSGDPLAPIPEPWRKSMRRALSDLSRSQAPSELSVVNSAQIVHVPSSRIHQPANVPLALQSDGTIDILSRPDDPAVIEEIKSWSSKQQLPSKGHLTPAIVHLHPLTSTPDLTKSHTELLKVSDTNQAYSKTQPSTNVQQSPSTDQFVPKASTQSSPPISSVPPVEENRVDTVSLQQNQPPTASDGISNSTKAGS